MQLKKAAVNLATKAATTAGFTAINVLFVIIELIGLLAQQPFVKPEYVPILVFIQAALNIVLRRFFLEDVQ